MDLTAQIFYLEPEVRFLIQGLERREMMKKLAHVLLKSGLVFVGAILPLAVNANADAAETGGQFLPNNAFYVSKNGNNTDGRSWKTAWNELDQVKWDQLSMPRPGRTVLNIDGGKGSMYYYRPMKVSLQNKVPMYGLPVPWGGIEIKRSDERGHDGTVVIDGLGRVDDLISISNYEVPTTFTGIKWRGIQLRGYRDTAIRIYGNNVSLSGIEIDGRPTAIAWVDQPYGGTVTGGVSSGSASTSMPLYREYKAQNGIAAHGYYKSQRTTFEAKGLIIHDTIKGFSLPGNVQAKISKSWVYQSNYAYPYPVPYNSSAKTTGIECGRDNEIGVVRPADAMPYFGPSSVKLTDCVIGPALSTGLLVGSYSDVSASNCLLLNATQCNVRTPDSGYGTPGAGISGSLNSSNLTSIMAAVNNERKGHDFVRNTGFTSNLRMSDSIVYGGNVVMPAKVRMGTGNTQFRTSGNTTAISARQINPLFVVNLDKIPYDVDPNYWSQLDYSLMPFSPARGTGSKLTSVRKLLNMSLK